VLDVMGEIFIESQYTIDEKIELIKEAILKHVQAKYIYLFGSYAYVEPTEDSDMDIYTVVPDDTKRTSLLYSCIIGDVRNIATEKDLDLRFKRENEFELRKTQSMFEKTIIEKGRLIYERK
jgi:predicted nucleotidyltransferase